MILLLLLALAHPVDQLVASATSQIGVTVRYAPEYRVIPYPGGDVPMDRGVCTDVIVRAYRGIGVDLQKLVNEDMRAHFDAYPHRWLARPDSNIDHRRVPNLAAFFARHGQSLPVSKNVGDYLPGDVVTPPSRLPQQRKDENRGPRGERLREPPARKGRSRSGAKEPVGESGWTLSWHNEMSPAPKGARAREGMS